MRVSAFRSAICHFWARDGIRLGYRELGTGRPLVLIHGYLSTADSWMRYGVAARIAAHGYRVIMPDLRGHGDSAKPHDASAYPPDVLVDDGLALIDELNLTDYDLGGYSLGGRVAARMLVRGATPAHAIVAGTGLDGIVSTTRRGGWYRHLLTHLGMFEPDSKEAEVEFYLRQANGDPMALLHVLDTVVRTTREELSRIHTPTLVLTGADEHDTGETLADVLPFGQFATVPGGHGDAPGNPEFAKRIVEFLA